MLSCTQYQIELVKEAWLGLIKQASWTVEWNLTGQHKMLVFAVLKQLGNDLFKATKTGIFYSPCHSRFSSKICMWPLPLPVHLLKVQTSTYQEAILHGCTWTNVHHQCCMKNQNSPSHGTERWRWYWEVEAGVITRISSLPLRIWKSVWRRYKLHQTTHLQTSAEKLTYSLHTHPTTSAKDPTPLTA